MSCPTTSRPTCRARSICSSATFGVTSRANRSPISSTSSGNIDMLTDTSLEQRLVRVVSIREEAIDTRCFDLVAADRRPLVPFTPGAHIDVHAPNGQVRQYSLCGDVRDTGRYTIAVKREAAGRGGSRSMHDDVEEGSALGIV